MTRDSSIPFVGEIVEVHGVDLSHEGYGIARKDNLVVIVPGLIPGETAKVRLLRRSRKLWYTEIIEFITISTLGDSQDFGDLNVEARQGTGFSSRTRANRLVDMMVVLM